MNINQERKVMSVRKRKEFISSLYYGKLMRGFKLPWRDFYNLFEFSYIEEISNPKIMNAERHYHLFRKKNYSIVPDPTIMLEKGIPLNVISKIMDLSNEKDIALFFHLFTFYLNDELRQFTNSEIRKELKYLNKLYATNEDMLCMFGTPQSYRVDVSDYIVKLIPAYPSIKFDHLEESIEKILKGKSLQSEDYHINLNYFDHNPLIADERGEFCNKNRGNLYYLKREVFNLLSDSRSISDKVIAKAIAMIFETFKTVDSLTESINVDKLFLVRINRLSKGNASHKIKNSPQRDNLNAKVNRLFHGDLSIYSGGVTSLFDLLSHFYAENASSYYSKMQMIFEKCLKNLNNNDYLTPENVIKEYNKIEDAYLLYNKKMEQFSQIKNRIQKDLKSFIYIPNRYHNDVKEQIRQKMGATSACGKLSIFNENGITLWEDLTITIDFSKGKEPLIIMKKNNVKREARVTLKEFGVLNKKNKINKMFDFFIEIAYFGGCYPTTGISADFIELFVKDSSRNHNDVSKADVKEFLRTNYDKEKALNKNKNQIESNEDISEWERQNSYRKQLKEKNYSETDETQIMRQVKAQDNSLYRKHMQELRTHLKKEFSTVEGEPIETDLKSHQYRTNFKIRLILQEPFCTPPLS